MLDKENTVEEPIMEYGQLDLNKSYTYWDYLKWKFDERVELIRGRILKMSPAPSVNHQALAGGLYGIFALNFSNSPCSWFPAPFDVRLPIPSLKKDTTVVQPDLCVICDQSKLDLQGCNGAPDLVIEILSPGNTKHELETKFTLYEESGVKEYWLVQIENRCILVYSLVNGKYQGLRPFVEGMLVKSALFPELIVPVEDVFKNVK